mgnify:CR=1 FL=1
MKSITSIYLLGDKNKGKIGRIKEISNEITSVSYTHLTLPTILRV